MTLYFKVDLSRGLTLSRNSLDLFASQNSEDSPSPFSDMSDSDESFSDKTEVTAIRPFSALRPEVQSCLDVELRGSFRKKVTIYHDRRSSGVGVEIEDYVFKVHIIFVKRSRFSEIL